MNVLGIGHDVWIASAAVVRDGEVVSAICEERLNRQKGFQGFPGKAIDACLKEAGLKFEDLDLVSVGWNPAWHMERRSAGRYPSRPPRPRGWSTWACPLRKVPPVQYSTR